MERESRPDWVSRRERTRAIICDIDNTILTENDKPIVVACQFLARLHPSIEVHYVTGRPDDLREETLKFLTECRLPGRHNLHLCPSTLWKTIREHKAKVIQRLAREHKVILSVGDSDEEEEASLAAGVKFLRVTSDNIEVVWTEIAELIAPHLEEQEV